MDNRTVARQLLDAAHALELKHASFYRVQAYRQAAQTVLGLDGRSRTSLPIAGRKALEQLPGIGAEHVVKIETLVRTGEIATLKEDNKRLVAV